MEQNPSKSGGDVLLDVLQPGQSIKPRVSLETATKLIRTHFNHEVTRIKELNSYDDRNFFVQASDLATGEQGKFVFKVLNSMDTKKPGHVEAENECLVFLAEKGIVCPIPKKSVHGSISPILTIPIEPDEQNNFGVDGDTDNPQHLCRLLTFVEGKILHDVPTPPKLLFQTGHYIADLQKLLKGFSHPALNNHQTIWLMTAAPNVRKFMYVIKDQPQKYDLVESVIDAFVKRVEPAYPQLEKGIMHGDYNEQNIIVRPNPTSPEEYEIHGLIDFGDLQLSHYVFELGITLCYMMLECMRTGQIDPFEGSGHALAGYNKERRVPELELQLLRTCVAARLCQSLVMGAYSHTQDPDNAYILTTANRGWTLLERLWNQTTDEQLIQIWKRVMAQYDGHCGKV